MTLASGTRAVVLLLSPALFASEPEGLLERFLARTSDQSRALPDYVCAHRVDRFSRGGADGPWKAEDTLRFLVGIAGGEEVYADAGTGGALAVSPAAHARYGVVNTGEFGLMARHVFGSGKTRIGYVGVSERDGRRAHEYEYDVPVEESAYTLRVGGKAARVAFQGAFHVDEETLDLIELEVQAYDLPDELGLASADTRVTYARVEVRGASMLLPSQATLLLVTADGAERLNRARFGDCRRFETQSAMVGEAPDAPQETPSAAALVQGAVLELALDEDFRPAGASPGDVVRARLLKPVETTDGSLIPPGAVVRGHVARLRREDVPVPAFEIGIEFDVLEVDGEELPLRATMVEVEGRSGVIRQAKRLDPNFSRRHGARADVLVREMRRGQGIVLWEARRPVVPKGLRMKWVAESAPELTAGRR
jgi:hypothetical protein